MGPGAALSFGGVSFKPHRHQCKLQASSSFAPVFSFGRTLGVGALRLALVGFGDFSCKLLDMHPVRHHWLSPLFFPQSFSNPSPHSVLHGIFRLSKTMLSKISYSCVVISLPCFIPHTYWQIHSTDSFFSAHFY